MKITFKNPEEQNQLVADMVSKDRVVSWDAQQAFGAIMGPLLAQSIAVMGTANTIYEDITYDEGVYPEIAVDPYFDAPEGTISVWSQNTPGGLPTNLVGGYKTIPVSTYELDSAFTVEKRVLSKSKIPLLEKHLARMLNEVLIKQERNAWAVIFAAFMQAVTNNVNHVFRTGTAGIVQMDDFNNWITLADRLNAAFNGGTPVDNYAGLTDAYGSPEFFAQIRNFVYQPQNTRAGSLATEGATALALPDSIREQLFKAGGNPSLFDVEFHKMWEFGKGNRKYNLLAKAFAGNKNYDVYEGSGGTAFDPSASQIVVGVNRNWGEAYRVVEKSENSTFVVQPDDQFVSRQQKIAYWGKVTEGRIIGTPKQFTGIIW